MVTITGIFVVPAAVSSAHRGPPRGWSFSANVWPPFGAEGLPVGFQSPHWSGDARSLEIFADVHLGGALLVGFRLVEDSAGEFVQAMVERPSDESSEDFALLLIHWLVSVALEDPRGDFVDSLELVTLIHPWLLPE